MLIEKTSWQHILKQQTYLLQFFSGQQPNCFFWSLRLPPLWPAMRLLLWFLAQYNVVKINKYIKQATYGAIVQNIILAIAAFKWLELTGGESHLKVLFISLVRGRCLATVLFCTAKIARWRSWAIINSEGQKVMHVCESQPWQNSSFVYIKTAEPVKTKS